MLTTRIIPCLLLRNQGLVKTVKFRDPKYVGDPINAVKIFNDKEVDELLFLDITATNERKRPSLKVIGEIASECFMPLAYGGGIRTLDDIREIFTVGVEKVCVNTHAVEDPLFISRAADIFGNQSIVVSIDVKKSLFGKYEVYTHSGSRNSKLDPVDHAVAMEQRGAGELFLNSIDRDGTQQGFDIELIRRVASAVHIPVIACGGAGTVEHLRQAVKDGGASAVSAGSMFVFHGRHRAVLISYPGQDELKTAFR